MPFRTPSVATETKNELTKRVQRRIDPTYQLVVPMGVQVDTFGKVPVTNIEGLLVGSNV